MGGHAAGATASQIAVDHTLFAYYADPAEDLPGSLVRAIQSANAAILQRAQQDPDCRGMGTTVVAVLIRDSTLWVAHAGDSRAYLVDDGTVTCLTQDHLLVRRLVEMGDITAAEAAGHPRRHELDRALGRSPVEVETRAVPLNPDDVIVLCSDGLHNVVGDRQMLSLVRLAGSPQEAAESLVEAAEAAGGEDNVTAVVIAQQETTSPRRSR